MGLSENSKIMNIYNICKYGEKFEKKKILGKLVFISSLKKISFFLREMNEKAEIRLIKNENEIILFKDICTVFRIVLLKREKNCEKNIKKTKDKFSDLLTSEKSLGFNKFVYVNTIEECDKQIEKYNLLDCCDPISFDTECIPICFIQFGDVVLESCKKKKGKTTKKGISLSIIFNVIKIIERQKDLSNSKFSKLLNQRKVYGWGSKKDKKESERLLKGINIIGVIDFSDYGTGMYNDCQLHLNLWSPKQKSVFEKDMRVAALKLFKKMESRLLEAKKIEERNLKEKNKIVNNKEELRLTKEEKVFCNYMKRDVSLGIEFFYRIHIKRTCFEKEINENILRKSKKLRSRNLNDNLRKKFKIEIEEEIKFFKKKLKIIKENLRIIEMYLVGNLNEDKSFLEIPLNDVGHIDEVSDIKKREVIRIKMKPKKPTKIKLLVFDNNDNRYLNCFNITSTIADMCQSLILLEFGIDISLHLFKSEYKYVFCLDDVSIDWKMYEVQKSCECLGITLNFKFVNLLKKSNEEKTERLKYIVAQGGFEKMSL